MTLFNSMSAQSKVVSLIKRRTNTSMHVILMLILLSITSCANFDTQQVESQDIVRFALIADPQMGFSDAQAKSTAYSNEDFDYFRLTIDKINKHSLAGEFVLILGDMVHKQSDELFQWPDYHGALRSLKIPYHEVMGNHDGWSAEGLVRWRDTWNKQDVYSFTHKGLLFVGLNSYFLKKPDALPKETAAQTRFLTELLTEQASNPHKFIFQHFPLYRDTPDEAEKGNKNLPLSERNFILEQIDLHNVKAVFSGHSHYEIIRNYKYTLLLTANPSSKPLGKGKRGFYIIEYNKTSEVLSYTFIKNTKTDLELFLNKKNKK